MKRMRLLSLLCISALLVSCQKEENPSDMIPGQNGDIEITIKGDSLTSSRGNVNFEGGYATGAGLYDSGELVTVSAVPNTGYEINYFYGGTEDEPHKYDYTTNKDSQFEFRITANHLFEVGFKEKMRSVTINSTAGGSVDKQSGEYQAEVPHDIVATPDAGCTFSNWSTEGDVKMGSSTSAVTTFTLGNTSSNTITATFTPYNLMGNNIFMGYPESIDDNCVILYKDNLTNTPSYWNKPESMAFGNNRYVIVGDDGYIIHSYNLNSWTRVGEISEELRFTSVCYGDGKFVAVGWKNIFAYSYDGISWNVVNNSNNDDYYSICYANNIYVKVGDYISYSYDGINWKKKTVIDRWDKWYSVCYGDGKFVAVGNDDAAVSTDGINWTASDDTGMTLNLISYGDGKFVAASHIHIGYSYDGLNWKWVKNGVYYGLTYSNGAFVAVGKNGKVSYSTDGIKWTEDQLVGGNSEITWQAVAPVQK